VSNFEYVVMTPPFMRGSAGIRFLNELTDDIRATGRKAHRIYSVTMPEGLVASFTGEAWFKVTPDWIKETVGNPEKLIVIHGENQDCKYFTGLNVARYYLNRIGALRKVGIPRDGEFKIAWVPEFCDNPDFLLRTSTLRYPLHAAEHISLDNRQIDLTYVGKAAIKTPGIGRLPATLQLKGDWPSNDDEYFYLLKNTRRLYTYDAVTSVVGDAITLGALPVSMTERITHPDFVGCVAHIEDDIDEFMKGYAAARLRYLETEARVKDAYRADLERCCVTMEKFFG
jgi:hypothetical protein